MKRANENDSVRNMLHNVIDFAGMFPPAKLALEDALTSFAKLQKHSLGYFSNRFVCPVSEAESLKNLTQKENTLFAKPLNINWLFQSQTTSIKLIQSLTEECQVLQNVLQNENIVSTAWEVSLNLEVLSEHNLTVEIGEQLFKLASEFQTKNNSQPIDICLEGVWETKHLHELSRAVGQLTRTKPTSVNRVVAKIRTGGLTAKQIPAVEHIASAISLFHDFSIPFKATAGLHDPVRHFDAQLNCWMHGFLNIFIGSMLYHEGKIKFKQLVECLSETDSMQFSLSRDEVSWREYSLSSSQVLSLRDTFATSFGSCSIAEPVQGLQKMGIIDPTLKV